MTDSRIKNTTRNIYSGLLNKFVAILLAFINRTAVLKLLGAEFTGLVGLFSSILSVLSIAELGFNTAIVYSLYRPMAEHDEEKICNLVSLFRKIYTIIGTVVLLAGSAVAPFLKLLIKGTYPNTINLYVVYFLYLINSGISYFLFAYKECLLIADQRQDIASNIRTAVSVSHYAVQLIVLILTKDFYLYLIVAIIGTIATNMMIQHATKRRYPFYRPSRNKQRIPVEIKRQVQGLMINRICDTFRNSFDSIIISSLIGLTATTIYGNYYYIYSAVYMVMLAICNAMGASVGNSIIQSSENKNFSDMLTFSMAFAWISGWCTVMLSCIYQPFMELWAGKDLMLSERNMLLFCLYFYAINMNNIRNQYISGTGLWWKLRKSYIIEAFSNLILNVVLGKIMGITGIILATIITIIAFNYFMRNAILFKGYFKNQSQTGFYREQAHYAVTTLIAVIMTRLICSWIPNLLPNMATIFLRIIVCVIAPNIVFLLSFRLNRQRFGMTTELIKAMIGSLKK